MEYISKTIPDEVKMKLSFTEWTLSTLKAALRFFENVYILKYN